MGIEEWTEKAAYAFILKHGPLDKFAVIEYLMEVVEDQFGTTEHKGHRIPQSVLLRMWDYGVVSEYMKNGKWMIEITTADSPKQVRID